MWRDLGVLNYFLWNLFFFPLELFLFLGPGAAHNSSKGCHEFILQIVEPILDLLGQGRCRLPLSKLSLVNGALLWIHAALI
jgi:hypothetical protein